MTHTAEQLHVESAEFTGLYLKRDIRSVPHEEKSICFPRRQLVPCRLVEIVTDTRTLRVRSKKRTKNDKAFIDNNYVDGLM